MKEDKRSIEAEGDPRELAEWSRRYARNRTIPVIVFLVMFVFFFLSLAFLTPFTGRAFRAENTPMATLGIVGLVMVYAGLLWFATPSWGGRFIERMGARFYAGEGMATVAAPTSGRAWPGLDYLAAFLFAGSILLSVSLGIVGLIPEKHMQPVSALYTVPFLVYLFIRMGPARSHAMLLWPGLYALHAILMVLGAPIRFEDPLGALNMFVPVVGYGLIGALAGHLYSRYALRRVKALARQGLAGGASRG